MPGPIRKFEVEELPLTDFEATLARIGERRARNLASYGAFIFRSCSGRDFDASELLFREYIESQTDLEVDTERFDESTPLHIDKAKRNSVTLHYTEEGATDFMVLTGATRRIRSALEGLPYTEDREDVTYALFGDSELCGLSPQAKMYRTSVAAGDMLLFDDSQPHAFEVTTSLRIAQAVYTVKSPSPSQ